MKLTTTFRLLRKAGACKPRYEHLREFLSRKEYSDDTPINLLTILETNGLANALWALRATEQNCDKVARLMAADFAESVLYFWQAKYPNDNRPELAIQAARDYANGLITYEELAAAREAAARGAASIVARCARCAARAAAYSAAYAAAYEATWASTEAAAYADIAATWNATTPTAYERDKQREIFIGHLQEEA